MISRFYTVRKWTFHKCSPLRHFSNNYWGFPLTPPPPLFSQDYYNIWGCLYSTSLIHFNILDIIVIFECTMYVLRSTDQHRKFIAERERERERERMDLICSEWVSRKSLRDITNTWSNWQSWDVFVLCFWAVFIHWFWLGLLHLLGEDN